MSRRSKMSRRPPKHSPSHPIRAPTLSGDIIFCIVRSNFHTTGVINNLSKTCRLYCGALDSLLYKADVLMAKQRVVDRRYQHFYADPFLNLSVGAESCNLYDSGASALHWAAKANDSVGITVAQKSIKAALVYWPDYLHVQCGRTAAMTPLQLAAKYGADEIIQELIKAGSLVDTQIILDVTRNPCKKFRLSELLQYRCFKATSLHIAMLYGHVHTAETLAHLTQNLEDSQETPGVFSPLKLAAMCKMPSVIKILQTRGYKVLGNERYLRDMRYTPIHFAASTDGNEETLRFLMNTGYSAKAVDNDGRCPFGTAIAFRCLSNALFLIKDLSAEEKLDVADMHFDKLIRKDVFLPVVKTLLEHNNIGRHRARRYKNVILKHYNNQDWRKYILDTLDFLIHHPNIIFSKNTHASLVAGIAETREEAELVGFFVNYSHRYKE
ncbi:ankyrin [Daldinia decipiens]|uniref:ankyrin n=1 Tax=Daldinia decipiens TaxID=326647 RepID=UPI0020C39774|nr:ankyrin [Daldinia decipiens]KAI1659154.1 ankyrin [Daldinia decipiens]